MPRSTMQDDYQLTIDAVVRARSAGPRQQQGDRRSPATATSRSTFAEVAERADRLASALDVARGAAGRPRGHVPVEQPDAPRGVPGHPVHGCGAAHAEHPPVPRAARLRHQPRRGQGHHRRRLDRPAAGEGARPADDRRADHRQGPGRHVGSRRRSARLRHAARRPSRVGSTIPSSTRAPAWPCATRAAPRATRRASCTATAARTCTR